MNITISIDDNHPEKGWGIQGDPQMDYLESLWQEFGAKFTLFIPSNYHKQYPISEHKDWIDWMRSKPYFELAAHGHYHMCNNPQQFGEIEFAELNDVHQITDRIARIRYEWDMVGEFPKGWRNPGWIASELSINYLQQTFQWVALHNQHNQGRHWGKCKMLFGHTGIHESSIDIQNNTVMFQSHIAGNHNDNIWSEANYEHFRLMLQELKQMDKCEFKTLSEL